MTKKQKGQPQPGIYKKGIDLKPNGPKGSYTVEKRFDPITESIIPKEHIHQILKTFDNKIQLHQLNIADKYYFFYFYSMDKLNIHDALEINRQNLIIKNAITKSPLKIYEESLIFIDDNGISWDIKIYIFPDKKYLPQI